jgi:penicillin-binding protein 1A
MRMWTPAGSEEPAKRPSRRDAAKLKPARPRPGKPKRPLWLRILKWTAITGFSGLVLAIATVAFVFWMYGRDKSLPDPSSLSDIKYRQVSLIVDKHGRRIGELFGKPDGPAKDEVERRQFVPYDQIPPILVDSFIATEDASYWEHSGVDYFGMFRAFWANLRAGKTKEGASTITQQVVKNLLLTPEKTFKRKIQEIILARRLESVLTKEEILTLYMNQIYFGNQRYGVQEAARFYFNKDVSKLDVGEAALLAGMPKSPETYAINREKNWKEAKRRQVHVLNRLVDVGKLTPGEAQKWIDAGLPGDKQWLARPFPALNSAPEWVGMVRGQLLERRCGGKATCPEGEEWLDHVGMTIRTTVDPALQDVAEAALQNGLRAVDERRKLGRPKRSIKPAKLGEELARLGKRVPAKGPAAGETYEAVITAVHDGDRELVVDLGSYQAGIVVEDRFIPREKDGAAAALSTRFKVNDVVDVVAFPGAKQGTKHAKHRLAFPRGPEGAVVILDVKSRKVRALVGGYAAKTLGLNRATNAKRQPGSSFKPFVFAAGIELGETRAVDEGGRVTFTAGSVLLDAPEPRWKDNWNAKNYEASKLEGPVLLRHALAKSINTVAIRVIERIKPERVIDLAQRVGIESALPETFTLALGSGEVTPLEMTNAMATFAAGGRYGKPVVIDAIDGKPSVAGETVQAIKPEVAYVVTHMMQSVVTSGTGSHAAKLKIPIAGKTGTSNEAKDVWFVGLTPDWAIGVWIGHDKPTPMGRETGGTTAVPVFVEIASAMKLPAKQFQRPPRIVDAKIDRESGLRAPEDWPKDKTVTEVFIEGTAPTEYATAEVGGKGEYDE